MYDFIALAQSTEMVMLVHEDPVERREIESDAKFVHHSTVHLGI